MRAANTIYPTIPSDWSLTITVNYDYSITNTETHKVTYSQMTVGSSCEQFVIFPLRQKCEAMQISIQENFATAGGFQFSIEGIQASVGILGKSNRIRSEKRG